MGMHIAIDAMGGDNAPQAVLEGVAQALGDLDPETTLTLFGEEQRLKSGLETLGINDPRIRVAGTTEIIGCNEQPTLAIRKKKDSSMVQAIQAVASGQADCVVSAGSTGALLTGATLMIKRLPGVKRPALATVLPSKTGCTLLLDCGANTDCKPEYLTQFAIMGSAYMSALMGVERPRVGLLNNGAEEEKGNELTKAAYQQLKAAPVNFCGNCEARDLLQGGFDVVAADGFDGNVALKSIEGAVALMMDMLKDGLLSSPKAKVGALLVKPALRGLKGKLDYTEYGGAPLLGVRGGVIKAHGSSNAKAFASAIRQGAKVVEKDVTKLVGQGVAELGLEG